MEWIHFLLSFITGEYPLYFLYILTGLPFLLLISELIIRKIIHQPFSNVREVLITIGYIAVGIVLFLILFQLIIRIIALIPSPSLSVRWTNEEVFFIGLLTLLVYALISPLSCLYVRLKEKVLQIIYLIGSSFLFIYIIGQVSMSMYDGLNMPVPIYAVLGLFHLIYTVLVTNQKLYEENYVS